MSNIIRKLTSRKFLLALVGMSADSDQNANIYTPLKLHLLSLPVPEAGRGGFASVKNYILNEYFIIATPKMEKHLSKMVMYLF